MRRRYRKSSYGWLVTVALSAVAPVPAKDLTVRAAETTLHAACGETGRPIALLPAGKKVRLRFAISASNSPCYAVTAHMDGRRLKGFVSREAVDGIESFEQSRRRASTDLPIMGTTFAEDAISGKSKISGFSPSAVAGVQGYSGAAPHVIEALSNAREMIGRQQFTEAEKLLAALGPEPGDPSVAVYRAEALLRLARVDSAHRVIQAALRTYPEHPGVLATAGLAAILSTS